MCIRDRLGLGQLFGKADLSTLGDEFLRPLAQFELIALHLEPVSYTHLDVYKRQAAKRGSELLA